MEEAPSKRLAQRLGRLALIWVMSVVALAMIAWLIRMVAL